MKTWTLRLGLSLMVVAAFWTGRVAAQEPILLVPESHYEPARHPAVPPAFAAPLRPAPATHPLHRAMNNHGLNCGVNPFYPACGNLHYELRFILGSCRSYFGESCPPNSWCGQKR